MRVVSSIQGPISKAGSPQGHSSTLYLHWYVVEAVQARI